MALSIGKAIAFAASKHEGQRDKGLNAYILHPIRVMLHPSLQSEDEKIVGVFHDIVEDTGTTLKDLEELGCTEAQLMAIDALTKKKDQPHADYIAGIKKSVVARKVKIADIEDNMILTRMKNRGAFTNKDLARINQYMDDHTDLLGF